jgi:beta-galactosidase
MKRILNLLIASLVWWTSRESRANDSMYPPQPAAASAINFDGRGFLVNGQRTFIASGSIHYPRVPQALWHDRLLRLKRAGLNCVQTYAFMNYHSSAEGQYDFFGEKDFNLFLQDAHDLGLYATVRAGLYVCAEWENGGYPNWLLQTPGLALRQDNAPFLAASDDWYAHVLPIVATNQINNGGSVILVQLENEDESLWGTDTNIPPLPYFQHLLTNALSLGIEVPMFFSGLHHASDPTTTMPTVPWDSIGRDTPWYTTEFWAGWFNQYGMSLSQAIGIDRITWKILAYGGNGYNYYMFHGGSDFDHWNDDEVAASYDYGAAVGQAGDLRTLYYRDKRAALFARTFQAILENSTNATTTYSNAASNVTAVTARGSPAGTILFLDNNTGGNTTAVLTNGAQMTLEASEIAPVVKNFALTSWININEADARILGAQSQGNITTLVLYGLPGETVRITFQISNGTVTSADTAFNTSNPNNIIFSSSVLNGSPASYLLSAGTNTLRLLVMSKTTVDRTWFVDSAGTNFVVSGPDYVGEFTNDNGQINCTLEEPLGSPLPTNILVYGTATSPRALTITNQIDSRPVPAPALVNWQMRLNTNAIAANYDDSAWLAANPPPLMGADGDSSAYAWYRAPIQTAIAGNYDLNFAGISDWGMLFVNGQQVPMQSLNQSFSVPVTLQAGTNMVALFTSHYGRSKLYNVYGTSGNTFTPKGLLGAVSVSAQTAASASLTNWYWENIGSSAPSSASTVQTTATNFNPVANGWNTGTNWNGDAFNMTAGYAWFLTTLPVLAGVSHSVHFVDVDDNCTVYLNGTNIVGTHTGWGVPFDVSLDAYWQTNGPNILTVLVQNTGYAGGINGAVTLSAQSASMGTWKMQGGLGQIDGTGVAWQPISAANGLPAFYRAEFQYQPPAGIQPIYRVTFGALSHGSIWLNGHALGRYPELIPINGIYLPECWLNSGTNALVIFDEQGNAPDEVTIEVETAASRQILQCADVNGSLTYPPATLAAIGGNGQVILNWSAVPGATGYNLKRAATSGGPYSLIGTNLPALSFTNIGAANGTTYYYVVSATNSSSGNESPNSLEENATPNPPPPASPTGLTAKSGNSQAILGWTAVPNVIGYNVKRSSTSGGPYFIIATNISGVTFTNAELPNGWQYYYVVSALNAFGESSNSTEVTAVQVPLGTLTGTIIGSSGSYNNIGNAISNVFDGDLATYYDAADQSGDWAGLDLGISNIITEIDYCPRATFASRMVGGVFQGDNSASFPSPVTLFTVSDTPPDGVMTKQLINNSSSFRYVRYLGPASSSCNVAEVRFIGYSQSIPIPSGLTATPGNGQVTLNWSMSLGATNYNVKRGTNNGGPYTNVGSSTNPNYTDYGLVNNITYYYVVSAVSLGGESTNSAQVSATPSANITLYDTSLLTFGPAGYWRLNEVSGTTAFDSSGKGFNGTYESGVTLDVSGPNPPFVGFNNSDNATLFQGLTNSYVSLPPLNLNSANVTFTAWINPSVSKQVNNSGLVFWRDSGGHSSGFCFANNGQDLAYNWNDDSTLWTYDSGLTPPLNQWSLVALVVTPTNAMTYLYNTNGLLSVTNIHNQASAAFSGEVRIGSDSMNDGIRNFQGRIAQVAVFNSSLNSGQINQIYSIGSTGVPAGSIAIQEIGANVQLIWSMGTLLEATNVTGPWTTNSAAASHYTVPATAPHKFYRLQLQ